MEYFHTVKMPCWFSLNMSKKNTEKVKQWLIDEGNAVVYNFPTPEQIKSTVLKLRTKLGLANVIPDTGVGYSVPSSTALLIISEIVTGMLHTRAILTPMPQAILQKWEIRTAKDYFNWIEKYFAGVHSTVLSQNFQTQEKLNAGYKIIVSTNQPVITSVLTRLSDYATVVTDSNDWVNNDSSGLTNVIIIDPKRPVDSFVEKLCELGIIKQ